MQGLTLGSLWCSYAEEAIEELERLELHCKLLVVQGVELCGHLHGHRNMQVHDKRWQNPLSGVRGLLSPTPGLAAVLDGVDHAPHTKRKALVMKSLGF